MAKLLAILKRVRFTHWPNILHYHFVNEKRESLIQTSHVSYPYWIDTFQISLLT